MMNSLTEAVRIADANLVHRAAHRLKGSLSVFGPGPHIQDCETLEEMALNYGLAQAQEVLALMEKHLCEFSAAVAELGKETHARADRR
jgi:HPt (histidine-containing phosphotransfer) domain-containing protein